MLLFFKKQFTAFGIFLILISCGDSSAQTNNTINSVDEAIDIALKNNSDVINANLDLLKARKRVSEVYSENLLPSLTLNARYSRAFKKQRFDIFGQSFEIGSDNTFNSVLDATEPIPVLGTPVFSGLRIAEYYEDVQNENLQSVKTDVKSSAKNSYYAALLAKSVLEVNKLTLKNAEENFAVVEAKYRNGVATEFDYLRAKVRVDNSKPNVSQAERNYEISRKLLVNVLGYKDKQDIEVTGMLTYDSTEVWQSTDYMINKISEENVLVRQLTLNKKINQELVHVGEANYMPKLYLFGQYTFAAQENDGRPIVKYRFYNALAMGLGLSWDLNLIRNSYKVDQAKIDVKKTNEQLLDLKQKLKLRSQSAIIALEDAKERIIQQKKTLGIAERGLELANISYKAGVLNQIDVQDAVFTLSQTRLAYLQAIYDYQIAKSELERLLEK